MKSTELKLDGINNYFVQEEVNVLRTNLQFCGQDIKTIAITSTTMNEGKTFISLQLGHSLSEIDKRVLIIDADLRKSVMAARYSDAKDVKGLSNIISGQDKLEDCVYSTQYPNLYILFAGQYPPNPVELLNNRHFEMLLNSLKEQYDYIVIDTPPLGMVIDAAVIATKCDGAIMVIGSRKVKYTQARDVLRQLEKVGCTILGAVLNKAESTGTGYYYRGRYGRYYRYEKQRPYGNQPVGQ